MRRATILLLTAGLALTACSGSDTGESSEPAGEQGGTGIEETAGGTASRDDAAERGGAIDEDNFAPGETPEQREVIRRASLTLQADDTRATFETITAIIETRGGFTAQAEVAPTRDEGHQPEITATLRVPADTLDATLREIKDTAERVVAETQHAEDVTEQYIDLKARLTNLEALEVELRALLEEVREQEGNDPEKILTVFRELSNVRGQIETLQGQLNYLEDATSLATVRIQLTQTPDSTPVVDEGWAPGQTVRQAAGNLSDGVQGVADWAITFAAYTLPMLVIITAPFAAAGYIAWRKFGRRRGSTSSTASAETGSADTASSEAAASEAGSETDD